MKYPFVYQVIGNISIKELSEDIQPAGDKVPIYDEWYLKPFKSSYLDSWLKQNFYGMELDDDTYFVSQAKYSLFHIDKRHRNYITHRILIPLDTYFQYQWFVNDTLYSYRPKAGEVLLFNNLVPHRFIMDEDRKDVDRCVVYFNVVDPDARAFLHHFEGHHTGYNQEMDKLIKQKLGIDR